MRSSCRTRTPPSATRAKAKETQWLLIGPNGVCSAGTWFGDRHSLRRLGHSRIRNPTEPPLSGAISSDPALTSTRARNAHRVAAMLLDGLGRGSAAPTQSKAIASALAIEGDPSLFRSGAAALIHQGGRAVSPARLLAPCDFLSSSQLSITAMEFKSELNSAALTRSPSPVAKNIRVKQSDPRPRE